MSKTLALIRLPNRFAIERYFAMEVLTSICCRSKRTSWLLALHIHGLHHFSVRINLKILRAFSWLVRGRSLANLRRHRLLKILHLSDRPRWFVWNFWWVSRRHHHFLLILLKNRGIMTLDWLEHKVFSFISVELLDFALYSSQVIVFRENLEPQLFSLLLLLVIVP
jgi:hypothetical protein